MTSVITEQLFNTIFLPNHEIQKKRPVVTSKSVKSDTDAVTEDVINVYVNINCSSPPNKTCEAIRWIINELMNRSNDSIVPLCRQIELRNEANDERRVITQVLNTVFEDDQINWGRIGITYVFGLRLAQQYQESGFGNRSKRILTEIGEYIKDNMTPWIMEQGGWESIRHHFHDEKELICKMKSAAVVLLTFGVGALTSVFT